VSGRSLVPGIAKAGVALLYGECCLLARCRRVPAATDMCFFPDPVHHVWVVQLEGGSLRTNPRQLGEVVPRRWAGGCPLQGVAIAPRVIDRDDLAVAVATENVPQERQRGSAEHERPDRRHHIQGGETVGG